MSNHSLIQLTHQAGRLVYVNREGDTFLSWLRSNRVTRSDLSQARNYYDRAWQNCLKLELEETFC